MPMVRGETSTISGITKELSLGFGLEGRQTGEMAFQAGDSKYKRVEA